MTEYTHFGGLRYNRGACDSDDQLALVSRVGRGIAGNSYEVRIQEPDTTNETYLEGWSFDQASKQWSHEWTSLNINGGELKVYYNLRPYTSMQAFTLTFIYRRPGRPEWSFTTPTIPYIWDANEDGEPDTDGLIGSGVGNLYVRASADDEWIEKLIFPEGTTAADFNSPAPEKPWTVNLTFGLDGDIKVPNIYDLAKIIGVDVQVLIDIVNDVTGAFEGYDNLKEYIDGKDAGLQTQIDELDQRVTTIEGDIATIKNRLTNIENSISALGSKYDRAIGDILSKIYGTHTMNTTTGAITWGSPAGSIPIGNMNQFAGDSNESYIRCAATGENDVLTR